MQAKRPTRLLEQIRSAPTLPRLLLCARNGRICEVQRKKMTKKWIGSAMYVPLHWKVTAQGLLVVLVKRIVAVMKLAFLRALPL